MLGAGREATWPAKPRPTDGPTVIMAGQILKDREVAGRLSAKIKTDRVQTGRPRGPKKNFSKIKIFFWTVLWPTGLHTVGRFTAFQLAGHHTISWPATSRSVFILADSWPATSRFSKILPVISRSVCLVAGLGKVGLFKNSPQTVGQFTDGHGWPLNSRPK
ncbi:hypothetical protein BpHYR1_039099 [Brachionus plicatilis]|uniref:Uncharacterized protein n=1 Tax=Brachionus plicatilis TaxID=10195 RepID=A0A3M7PFW5_BRAPC|nr:hypothetical protein BpHYR1_039099 [Brachionus plicatilis]